MPCEDGYLKARGKYLPLCKPSRPGLYGLFVRPENGDDWMIALFERHVLIFGQPPLDVEITNLKDERHKEIRRYAMAECLFQLCQLAENEYAETDHEAVFLEKRARLLAHVPPHQRSNVRDVLVDRGVYVHHGVQLPVKLKPKGT